MSKYEIKHSCGHITTHNIVGTNVNNEREKKAEWLASRVCSDCYRKQLANNAAETNKNLPQLTGSEKQIAWAESIRAKANKSISPILDQIKTNSSNNPHVAEIAASVVDDLFNKTNSSFWIDNRFESFDLTWISKETKKALENK